MLSKPVKPEVEVLDNDDDIPDNSPFRFQELTDRLLEDRRLAALWERFIRGGGGAASLYRELDYRLGHGQNHLILEIHGPPGIGKTMVAITLYKESKKILVKRGITVNFEVTLNYSTTTPAILKYPYSKRERVICIEDEDEELSGTDSERQLKAFRNLLKQGRKLGFVLIKCNADRDPNIKSKVSFAIEVWGQAEGWLICLIESRTGYPLDFVRIKYPDKDDRDWYEGIKDANMVHLQESQGMFGAELSVDEENEKVEEVYNATLEKYPNQVLLPERFDQIAQSLFGKLGDNTWKRIKKLAWSKYKINGQPCAPREFPTENVPQFDTKYSDEGFEENILQTLPEFHKLWLDDLYLIPPRRNENGTKTDYPDVIGILKDGSVGLCNAKYWAWRNGDSVYVGGERGKQRKINAELQWCDKLQYLGFSENKKIIVFVQHKVTKQICVKEVLPEKCRNGSRRVRLDDLIPTPTAAEMRSNLSPEPEKKEEEATEKGGETPRNVGTAEPQSRPEPTSTQPEKPEEAGSSTSTPSAPM